MRKLFALLCSMLLVLGFEVSLVSAQEPYITDITVTSVKVDRICNMQISGYMYCQNIDINWKVEAQGQVTQSIGRKTQLRGGIWGGLQCNPNGPTWFEVWSFADWGRFATTWTGIQLGFGQYYDCNEFGCNWRDFGGGQWWLKAGKM